MFRYLLFVLLLQATSHFNFSWMTLMQNNPGMPKSNPFLLVSAHGDDGDYDGGGERSGTRKTGSWANCREEGHFKSLTTAKEELLKRRHHSVGDEIVHHHSVGYDANADTNSDTTHPDSDMVTISCTRIHYRVPKESVNFILNYNNFNSEEKEPIIIGVLSAASGEGPSRRKSIRSTWAYRKRNIFFIVAGPWDEIEYEYETYGDMIWIDKEEVYVTETSVLTFKTESFVAVMYNSFMKDEASPVKYLFKADDDSYVDLEKLYRVLLGKNDLDYWGKCNKGGWKPHRDESNKWYISRKTYPEPEYPPFCQGAGIAMSRRFLDCAVGLGHISKIRYQPNEDVAIGLLAERCNIKPKNNYGVLIRYEDENEPITMHKKIVQHYVKTEEEMRLHHKDVTGVLGPRLV